MAEPVKLLLGLIKPLILRHRESLGLYLIDDLQIGAHFVEVKEP